ncbi:MAG: hypothetical protein FWH02_05415 [Oscillospiraceae bacterium]|nr:hypothetical protein [Oscillospiraceae bacterium]
MRKIWYGIGYMLFVTAVTIALPVFLCIRFGYNLELYDISVITVLCIFLFLTAIIAFFFKDTPKLEKEHENIVNSCCKKRDMWFITSIIWFAMHYFFSAMSILCTIIVIYANQKPDRVILYSTFALLFTFFILIANPRKNSLGFKKAWLKIYRDILKYDNDEITESDLISSLNESESFITKSVNE